MRTAVATRSTMLDAIRASLNNGYIRVYSGTRPAGPDSALSGNTLLAELRFGATAFPAASGGVLTANAITGEDSALASGTASFVRLLRSDGTTAEHDLSVSATGGGGEAQFATTTFTAGVAVNLSSLTITAPLGT